MAFQGVRFIEIDRLRLTQMYLSKHKLDGVLSWFNEDLSGFEPVPVHDFLRDGELYLTDGHTRAFAAWQAGLKTIPVIYDNDDIVTNAPGQRQYKRCIEWCESFGLRYISALGSRILDAEDYEKLWIKRCSYMHTLENALLGGAIDEAAFLRQKAVLERRGVYVLGISEDYKLLHCENADGERIEVMYGLEG